MNKKKMCVCAYFVNFYLPSRSMEEVFVRLWDRSCGRRRSKVEKKSTTKENDMLDGKNLSNYPNDNNDCMYFN